MINRRIIICVHYSTGIPQSFNRLILKHFKLNDCLVEIFPILVSVHMWQQNNPFLITTQPFRVLSNCLNKMQLSIYIFQITSKNILITF